MYVCCRVLSEARGLRQLPALNGSARLRTLRVSHARLAALPADLCASVPQLRSLSVPTYLFTLTSLVQRSPES